METKQTPLKPETKQSSCNYCRRSLEGTDTEQEHQLDYHISCQNHPDVC